MRALRVDKTCLMVLERTLHLFRDPALLRSEHPTYRMVSTPMEALKSRARKLARLIAAEAPEPKPKSKRARLFWAAVRCRRKPFPVWS